jgi:hypothetical protein
VDDDDDVFGSEWLIRWVDRAALSPYSFDTLSQTRLLFMLVLDPCEHINGTRSMFWVCLLESAGKYYWQTILNPFMFTSDHLTPPTHHRSNESINVRLMEMSSRVGLSADPKHTLSWQHISRNKHVICPRRPSHSVNNSSHRRRQLMRRNWREREWNVSLPLYSLALRDQ